MNLSDLKSKIKGRVITAESKEYDAARMPWLVTVDQTPLVIVAVKSAQDIAEAVQFAGANGLKISVKNTGHGIALPANDSMLILVSEMKEVSIDKDKQTARVEAGALWNDVLVKAHKEGLAPLMGSSSYVGAVGYTLGGGMGWLARKYGLSLDNVVSFDVVTADGKMVKASLEENQELFWAMKGGGAAFGIVSAMEIRLFPVKTVYAGMLIYPPAMAKEVLLRYKDWIPSLNDDWTTSAAVENFPDLPIVPDFLRGQSVTIVRACCSGSAEEGETGMKTWFGWRDPIANTFGVIPFSESDHISEDPKNPTPVILNNLIFKELSEEVINIIVSRGLAAGPTPLFKIEIHPAGGAMARMEEGSAAYSQHGAPFILKFIGLTPTPEMEQVYLEIIQTIREELKPHATGGMYLNFTSGEEKWNSAKAVYSPETLNRLRGLKNQYDPKNLFSFSMNFPME